MTTVDLDRQAFLAERRKGLGGSDVAAILGLDPRTTPYKVWCEKVGRELPEKANTHAMRRGNFLEAAVLRRYAKMVNPAEVVPQVPHCADGGWRRGNQDARIVMPDGTRRCLEIKSVNRHVFKEDWGEPWTDEVPDRALCQGLWYANLDNSDLIEWAVLVMPDDPDEVLGKSADEVVEASKLHIFQSGRVPDHEADIIERARLWWEQYVVGETEPPAMVDDAPLRWPGAKLGVTKPGTDIIEKLKKYQRLGQIESTAKAAREELRGELLLYLQDAEALVGSDGAPWLTAKTQKRAAYEVKAGESRVLRFTKHWTALVGEANPIELNL